MFDYHMHTTVSFDAKGTPEEICQVPESYTGQFLKPYLER